MKKMYYQCKINSVSEKCAKSSSEYFFLMFAIIQGPFRDPSEVQKQRYKPLQPTLRVATSYTSTEEARAAMKAREWIMRVNDNM